MDLITKTLLWKEWRERRWAFVVCLAWVMCGVVYVIVYESVTGCRTPLSRYGTVCLIYSLCMSVFLAMRVTLSEVTNHSLSFSRALPVSLSRIATVRLGVALSVLLLPILLGALILLLLVGTGVLEQVLPRSGIYSSGFDIVVSSEGIQRLRPSLSAGGAAGLLVKLTCVSVVQTAGLFLLLCVAGARWRSEVHVGFLGAVIAFFWLLVLSSSAVFQGEGYELIRICIGAFLPQSLVIYASYGAGAGGVSWHDLILADRIWLPLGLNLLLQSGMAIWFSRRYGTRNGASSPGKFGFWKIPPVLSLISTPLPRPFLSLVWINLRQSVPLALTGLALAGLMVVMSMVENQQITQRQWGQFRYSMPGTMWILATLWAAVVGAGVMAAELSPGLGHFRMSRPISIRTWFWFKYLIGLLAVLIVLDGTTIVVSWDSLFLTAEEKANYVYGSDILSWSYIACLPLLHSLVYSLTILAVCWWKRPVRGATTALAVFLVCSSIAESIPGVTQFEPITVYNNLHFAELQGNINFSGFHFPLVYGMVFVAIITTAYLASRRVRRLEF